MTEADVPAVATIQLEGFVDLDRRFGIDTPMPADMTRAYARIRHLIETDPGGAWVAEQDGEVRGAALALLREGVWGLSLLVVSPAHQSAGLGRSLLENALAYAADARAGIILSGPDARGLRAYHRAGFDLRPVMDAHGPVGRRPAAEPGVRRGRWPEDREIVDAAGRFVRGAGHGRDVPAWLELGGEIHVHEAGGFAVRVGGDVKVLAAHEPNVAAAILRAVLHDVPEGEDASVEFIGAGQEWAVGTALDAGLQLRPAGAIMVRGEPGPMAPYIPSGAYL